MNHKTIRTLAQAGYIVRAPSMIGDARQANMDAIHALLAEATTMMDQQEEIFFRLALEKLNLARDLAYQLTNEVWRVTEDGRQAVLKAKSAG